MTTPSTASLVLLPPRSGIPAVDQNGIFTPEWMNFFHQQTAPKVNYINSTYINQINASPSTSGLTVTQRTGQNAYEVNIGLSSSLESISSTPNGAGALTNNGNGSYTYEPIPQGTITSISVVSANGFSGTVATATTTPAITLSTTVSGIIKGSAGSLVAAVSGTDYYVPGGALGTPSSGNLANCTFPTLNQNTTGYAAGLAGGVVGSLPYQSAPNTTTLLAPNTTNNPMFLQSQGTGSAGLAPTWTSNLTVNSFTCSSSISTTTYIYVGIQGTNEQSGEYYYQNTVQTPIVSTSIIDASGTTPTVGNAWLHHHSTVSPCTMYMSRSNSSTTGHAPVTNGMTICAIIAMGSTQSGASAYEYQPFGQIGFAADATGTISATSAPGQFQVYTTPNGSLVPTLALTINNAGAATFAAGITATTGTFSGAITATTGGFSGGVTASSFAPAGATPAGGGLGYNGSFGIYLQANTGSSYDMALVTPSASAYILRVPTGTTNVQIPNGTLAVYGSITSNGNTVPTETDSTWTPSFTSLTVVGTPTYTGKYKQIGNVIYWTLLITSTTTTASTAGTTYFNLPTTPASGSTMTAAETATVASYGTGIVTTTHAYPPTWAAVASVTLSGFYFTT